MNEKLCTPFCDPGCAICWSITMATDSDDTWALPEDLIAPHVLSWIKRYRTASLRQSVNHETRYLALKPDALSWYHFSRVFVPWNVCVFVLELCECYSLFCQTWTTISWIQNGRFPGSLGAFEKLGLRSRYVLVCIVRGTNLGWEVISNSQLQNYYVLIVVIQIWCNFIINHK